jgi:hypothetical protein
MFCIKAVCFKSRLLGIEKEVNLIEVSAVLFAGGISQRVVWIS